MYPIVCIRFSATYLFVYLVEKRLVVFNLLHSFTRCFFPDQLSKDTSFRHLACALHCMNRNCVDSVHSVCVCAIFDAVKLGLSPIVSC